MCTFHQMIKKSMVLGVADDFLTYGLNQLVLQSPYTVFAPCAHSNSNGPSGWRMNRVNTNRILIISLQKLSYFKTQIYFQNHNDTLRLCQKTSMYHEEDLFNIYSILVCFTTKCVIQNSDTQHTHKVTSMIQSAPFPLALPTCLYAVVV